MTKGTKVVENLVFTTTSQTDTFAQVISVGFQTEAGAEFKKIGHSLSFTLKCQDF